MAVAISKTNISKQILLLWRKTIPQSIPFPVNKLFKRLLRLNQYVCKNLTKTDIYLLIIPHGDLEDLLNDPVFQFPQVKLVYVYYENNESFERDQIELQYRHPKLRFCHERDLPRELDKPIIDNAVDPSRPIDRVAIDSFASSVTERLSTKRPTTSSRRLSISECSTSALLHGFTVKDMELIDSRFKCPNCKLILREPYQLSCGHRTCQACIKVENDAMSCLICSEVSSSPNIWRDKGFRRELEQLLISCAVCGLPESLKRYQEHIDHTHQEHVNTAETRQTNYSIILALLRSISMPTNNDQRQNSFSEIQHQINILSHAVNLLNNDQQRIRDEFCSSQNRLQTISQQMVSLKSSSQHNVSIANGIEITINLMGQEISSLKQMVTDSVTITVDDTFLWKITSVAEKIADAKSERHKSIYSPVFYSSLCGYKMCMRLYLNGDGDVRGEYISLFLVLMRGDYDAILQWPFQFKIKFELIDQSTLDHNQRNISGYFWPDTTLTSFQRPHYRINEAYGIKNFCPVELLEKCLNLYIRDDVMFIRFQGNYLEERPASLVNTGTGATPNDEGHVDTINENIVL